MRNIVRRLRGALGNALLWGATWFGAGMFLNFGVYLMHGGPFWEVFLAPALAASFRFSIVGFVIGGAFSGYIASAFRNRRLEDLSVIRFTLGGGLVATLLGIGLEIVLLSSPYRVVHLNDLLVPALMAGTLGGFTAYGSLRLAQHAMLGSGELPDELETGQERLLPEG